MSVCLLACFLAVCSTLNELLPVPVSAECGDGSVNAGSLPPPTLERGVVPGAPKETVDQAYVLEITPKGVTIVASGADGERYARATLDQLRALSTDGTVPCCRIVDWPKLAWRGFMLDTRNFVTKECVKDILDAMARYKLNLFHWHLTENNAWRLESKRHPELQAERAFVIRHPGKFYTQDDFREVVDYAFARGIRVMPEFDLPGHSTAFREAFGLKSMKGPRVGKITADLFDELCGLAPKEKVPFVHVGGDEVVVPDVEAAERSTLDGIAAVIARHGRTVVGWKPGEDYTPAGDCVNMFWTDKSTPDKYPGDYFDAYAMYVEDVDPFELLPLSVYHRAGRFAGTRATCRGALFCAWHDGFTGERYDDFVRNVQVFPSCVLFANTFWHGRETDHPQFMRALPRGTDPLLAEAADVERRVVAQRDRVLKDLRHPFHFVRQTDMRWRLKTADGRLLADNVAQATIYPHWPKEESPFTEATNGTVIAETWIKSPADQSVGAWIGFTAMSRDGGLGWSAPLPQRSEWNRFGATAELNGERIEPPEWKRPGLKGGTYRPWPGPWKLPALLEEPFEDQEYYMREPTRIHLKKGWNHVKLTAPITGKVRITGPRWVMTFVPVEGTTDHPREVPGLEYASQPPAALDPLMPILCKSLSDRELADELRSARANWGFRRFVLVGPGTDMTRFNLATVGAYEQVGRRIAQVRGHLSDTDIELGWWACPTLRQGHDAPGQHIVDAQGHVTDGVCPLDPVFAKAFLDGVTAVCREGRPSVVFIEDDYELKWHRGADGMGGCFCPRHLDAFAARYGRRLPAAEIARAFRERTETNEPLRRAFAETQKASLVEFAKGIRAAIDAVDPKTRTCLCQSGRTDVDGDTTEAIARALAGGTRPMIRVYGSVYNSDNRTDRLPQALAHTAWTVGHLPQDIELIHESDSYPHNRFFASANCLGSEICGAFMAGVSDSYFYGSQYLDDPFGDSGYADWFARNRARLAAVRDFRRGSTLAGVGVSYDAKEQFLVRERPAGGPLSGLEDAVRFLGRMGFPSVPGGSGFVLVLTASAVRTATDDEIRRILAGSVFLDATAAAALSERGFAELLGVGVERVRTLPATDERILPPAGCRGRGKHLNCFLLDPVGGAEPTDLVRLTPHTGAETWAEYAGPDGKPVSPSVTYFENRLGGRIGTMACGIWGNKSSGLYSTRKQELLSNLFVRLSRCQLDVCADRTPSVWTLAAVSSDGTELLVMVNNQSGEERNDVSLRLAAKWNGASVDRLSSDGIWERFGTAAVRWNPRLPFGFMQPEFFRFRTKDKGMSN